MHRISQDYYISPRDVYQWREFFKNKSRGRPGFRLSKKPRRVFSLQRKNKYNRFLRRRVRRGKHFSRSEVSNCTPPAYNRGKERSASPFVEEGQAFFDKLKSRGRPGFKQCDMNFSPFKGRQAALIGVVVVESAPALRAIAEKLCYYQHVSPAGQYHCHRQNQQEGLCKNDGGYR